MSTQTFSLHDVVEIVSIHSTWYGKIGIVSKLYDSGLYGICLVDPSTPHAMRRFSRKGIQRHITVPTQEPVTTTVSNNTTRIRQLESRVRSLEAEVQRLSRISTTIPNRRRSTRHVTPTTRVTDTFHVHVIVSDDEYESAVEQEIPA